MSKPTLNQLKKRFAVREEIIAEHKKRREEIPPHLSMFTSTTCNSVKFRGVYTQKNMPPAPDTPPTLENPPPAVENPPSPKKMSKLSQQLQDFQDHKDELLNYLFEREHHPLIGQPCACGRDKRLVCCAECIGHSATCRQCFVLEHATRPTHWANVWQEEGGFFARRDILRVLDETKPSFAIPLGHDGHPCPRSPKADVNVPQVSSVDEKGPGVFFHIVDGNGIHNTRVQFCHCNGPPDRVPQLMKSGLFPATFRRPTVAFTFTVLKQFHIHNLEGKESAYDFFGSLRHLTDNLFALDVTSNLYEEFLGVMRFWRVLMATKRLRQGHGIDSYLPHRPPGNLLVCCPACPEVGLNVEKHWAESPPEFVHLNQTQLTLDGNFHVNRYKKNSTDNDYSLFEGRSYYPPHSEFKAYLKSLPNQDLPDEIECPLKAVKNRNLVMNNLSETGVINVQCPHAIVRSTVDLQKGEQFANTDYALATAFRQFQCGTRTLLSYDMSCSFWKKISERFKEHFPHLAHIVKDAVFLIPLVHVHNHIENCEYLYSSAYRTGAGHFHGETAEHEWSELNQVATQVRQMNNGHRQDTLIDHHGHWNFKKMALMSASLEVDIVHSRKLFLKKRELFIGLTKLYSDRAQEWDKLDRTSRTVSADNQIECVFRHKSGNVPSQSKIYESLIANIKATYDKTSDQYTDAKTTLCFLNEGIVLQRQQHELASKISSSSESMSVEEIHNRRKKLSDSIKKWKSMQKGVMSDAMEAVCAKGAQVSSVDEPEKEKLYLPSDFSLSDHSKLDIVSLADKELLLRKGGLFDHIRLIQHAAKTLSVLRDDRKEDRGQRARTRSLNRVEEAERHLLVQIELYNDCRQAVIKLGGADYEKIFPFMTQNDTYRMPTHKRREIGSSRKSDGKFYHPGLTGGPHVQSLKSLNYSKGEPASGAAALIQTQGSKGKERNDKKRAKDKKGTNRKTGIIEINTLGKAVETVEHKPDGWIWDLGAMGNMTSAEMKAWSDESDQVQWFRAEAEMLRWQEENEINQAQFLRCIRTFNVMSSHWMELANSNHASPGRVVYAKKTAARYSRLAQDAKIRLNNCGYAHLVADYTSDNAPPLAFLMQKNRVELYAPLASLLSSQPPVQTPDSSVQHAPSTSLKHS